MKTLIYIGAPTDASHDMETLLGDGHISSIAKSSLEILGLFTNENEFHQIFFIPNSFRIYLQIILPFLKLTEKEKEDMDIDPKEFINYSIDIC